MCRARQKTKVSMLLLFASWETTWASSPVFLSTHTSALCDTIGKQTDDHSGSTIHFLAKLPFALLFLLSNTRLCVRPARTLCVN